MKTYIILFSLLFIGSFASSQKPLKDINSTSQDIQWDTAMNQKDIVRKHQQTSKKSEIELVRLYKYKNSRIKKALSFSTPRNKAKLV